MKKQNLGQAMLWKKENKEKKEKEEKEGRKEEGKEERKNERETERKKGKKTKDNIPTMKTNMTLKTKRVCI